jgi:hypothetical protein
VLHELANRQAPLASFRLGRTLGHRRTGWTPSTCLCEKPAHLWSVLAEGQPEFSSGTGRFTIGITGRDGTTYHLTTTEARHFVDYVDEHT